MKLSPLVVSIMASRTLPAATVLIISLASICSCKPTTIQPADPEKNVSTTFTNIVTNGLPTKQTFITRTIQTTIWNATKEFAKTTKAYESTTSSGRGATRGPSTKAAKSARQKFAGSSALSSGHTGKVDEGKLSPVVAGGKLGPVGPASPVEKSGTNGSGHSGSLDERLSALECELPVLPRESRLWRGNETHELNLPVTMSEECGEGVSEEECPPLLVSWEGAADIQSGDVLIVRIADAGLLTNRTRDNTTHSEHRSVVQPAVYQVTRLGHEHCDVSDGMLLDITPLAEQSVKIFTLYDKDLTEGVNLLIVVSESWGEQCVRLKVTLKSDNCGDAQECSGKGVCYTNINMEGYECQCCPGLVGPHCEEPSSDFTLDACNPSPCLNNGICTPYNGTNYHCLCPYGFTGRKCENDPCSSTPCMHGGSCMSMAMNGSTTFHCACADGWTGAHCELPVVVGSLCASNPCINGICREQTDDVINGELYLCYCPPGFTGDHCEVEYNECESSPCVNGGSCTDRVAGFMCACPRGYTGPTCHMKVDLCVPNPCGPRQLCVDHGSTYSCECPRGYFGEECLLPARSICDNKPCEHGGTCWADEVDVHSFYCSCRPGYTGRLCEEDFILESVSGEELPALGVEGDAAGVGGAGGEGRGGLHHDRLHHLYIAGGTLAAAIAIVGLVVTTCHCRVNKTYSRLLSRLSRASSPGPAHHWLQDKRAPPPAHPPPAPLDTTDMYYTLDFSDSQSSPLIQ